MLPRLLLKRGIQQSHVDQSLVKIRAHMSGADEYVGYAACRAAVIIAFLARSYSHLNPALNERCALAESAISHCPQVVDDSAIQIRTAREPRKSEKESE